MDKYLYNNVSNKFQMKRDSPMEKYNNNCYILKELTSVRLYHF